MALAPWQGGRVALVASPARPPDLEQPPPAPLSALLLLLQSTFVPQNNAWKIQSVPVQSQGIPTKHKPVFKWALPVRGLWHLDINHYIGIGTYLSAVLSIFTKISI